MKDNNDRDIPYVSKELCVYLREQFSLQNLLAGVEEDESAERILGGFLGINYVLSHLEGICVMQEERHGIHR